MKFNNNTVFLGFFGGSIILRKRKLKLQIKNKNIKIRNIKNKTCSIRLRKFNNSRTSRNLIYRLFDDHR